MSCPCIICSFIIFLEREEEGDTYVLFVNLLMFRGLFGVYVG